MTESLLHRLLASGALIGLVLSGSGCGSPSDSGGDAGEQHDVGSEDASVDDNSVADTSVDGGPFNALGPCDSDDDCDPAYSCSFSPNGVRICIAVGTKEDGDECGLPSEYQANRRCTRGSHCDYLQRPSYAGLVCRQGCETYTDCEAHESCIQDAFPGEGGLCVPSSCDFDAILSGETPDLAEHDRCSCVPWEIVGEVGRARDRCAVGNYENIGEQCADTGSMVSWCNTWAVGGEEEGLTTTGVASVCVPGATAQTCRQLCRDQADCVEQDRTCTDITSQLTPDQLSDLVAGAGLDHPIAQIQVCIPTI